MDNESLDEHISDLLDAMKPFVLLMTETSGRIPTERLSFEDWHKLTKAYNHAVKCLRTPKAEKCHVVSPNDDRPYSPPGIQFLDMATNRVMRLVSSGPYADWIVYLHPDGQWVTLRKATDDDRTRLDESMLNGKRICCIDGNCPECR